jgi:hypothetical protein
VLVLRGRLHVGGRGVARGGGRCGGGRCCGLGRPLVLLRLLVVLLKRPVMHRCRAWWLVRQGDPLQHGVDGGLGRVHVIAGGAQQ